MSSAILLEDRFANVEESRLQGAKRSNMGSALQQLGIFPDSQKSLFQGSKR